MARSGGTWRKSANGAPKGLGYGGEAKGAGNNSEPKPFELGNQVALNRFKPENVSKREWDQQRTEELEALLLEAARGANTWGNIPSESAAAKLHAIINGQPVARHENKDVDEFSNLTDDEVAAKRAEFEQALREAAGGAASPSTEEELPRVRH